jgi:hypothetical protein
VATRPALTWTNHRFGQAQAETVDQGQGRLRRCQFLFDIQYIVNKLQVLGAKTGENRFKTQFAQVFSGAV